MVWRALAVEGLEGIHDFIAADNRGRAASFVAAIRERAAVLREHPGLGPAREELGEGIRLLPALRRVVVAYRVVGDAIVVVRVFYGEPDYRALLGG